MVFPHFTIEPPTPRRRLKGRTFRARLFGYLTADGLWEFGGTGAGVLRPVWLAYFATVGEARPFTANLRAGRPARIEHSGSLQIPKSSGHRWRSQPVPGGVVTIAYLPGLFHLEPPVPFTGRIGFVMAPARRWVEREAPALAAEFGDEARDAARAALFAAYLDRRTPLPLLRDLRFHLRLYRAALDEPWVADLEDAGVDERFGLASCGLDGGLVCSVGLEELAGFVTAQTAEYHRLEVRSGHAGRTLPSVDLRAAVEPAQLALDLGSG